MKELSSFRLKFEYFEKGHIRFEFVCLRVALFCIKISYYQESVFNLLELSFLKNGSFCNDIWRRSIFYLFILFISLKNNCFLELCDIPKSGVFIMQIKFNGNSYFWNCIVYITSLYIFTVAREDFFLFGKMYVKLTDGINKVVRNSLVGLHLLPVIVFATVWLYLE